MKPLIYTKTGELKELDYPPEGSIVSCKFTTNQKIRQYGIVIKSISNLYPSGLYIDSDGSGSYLDLNHDIVIHDIVDKKRKSTHQKMWVATDKELRTFIYYTLPQSRLYSTRHLPLPGEYYRYVKKSSNTINQTREDDPRPVWVEL